MKAGVLAKRTLFCPEDPERGVTVVLGKPVLRPKTNEYTCTYEIVGGGISRSRFAAGLDAFQALQLAMRMIGAEIAQIERASGIHLTFGDLPNSGFPKDGYSGA